MCEDGVKAAASFFFFPNPWNCVVRWEDTILLLSLWVWVRVRVRTDGKREESDQTEAQWVLNLQTCVSAG